MAARVLRESGFPARALALRGVQPHSIEHGESAVTMEVPARSIEAIAATEGFEYVRPTRMHRMHLDTSRPLVEVNAAVTKRHDGAGIQNE